MELKTLKKEIIKRMYLSKEIYLMAHSNIDLDAYASMVGFSLIAKKFRKAVYIVIDDEKIESATSLALESTSKYVKIIKTEEAKKQKKKKKILVVLDVNKPNLTALSPPGKFEIYNDKTKRAITTPAIIKPILNLLSIFIISPKLPKNIKLFIKNSLFN